MAQQWRKLLAVGGLTLACACDDSSAGRPDETAPIDAPVVDSADAPPATGDEPVETVRTVPPSTTTPPLLAVEDAVDYEWSPVQIGAGGYVTGIVFGGAPDAPTTYARTDVGGAFRWEEGDRRWRQMILASALQDGALLKPGDYRVASIAAAPGDGNVVYVAVGDDFNPDPSAPDLQRTGRVLHSADGGATWTSSGHQFFVAGNQQFRVGSERLAVHPGDPDRVVLGTQREGLWRSDDGGASWTHVPVGTDPATSDGEPDLTEGDRAGVNLVSYATAPDGTVLLVVGVAEDGVFVSADDGATWAELVELGEGEVPASATVSGSTFIFAVHTPTAPTSRMFRFDLGDPTAADEVAGPEDVIAWHVAADPFDPQHLVLAPDAVADGRWWTSRDGGTTWTVHDVVISSPEIPWLEQTDLDSYMSTGRLVFDPAVPGRLWFAEGMGVWRTDDTDAPEVALESTAVGIEETVVSGVIGLPDGSAIVTIADRQGFRIVEGSFPERTLVDERFASGSMAAVSAGHPEVVAWVGAESNMATAPDRTERGAVSTDGGVTFTEMGDLVDDMYGGEVAVSTTDPATMVWLPTHPIDPTAFESDPVGLFVSRDGGRSWENVSVDGADDSFHRLFWWFSRRALAADATTGAFYLMSDAERFYVSDDGASTWQEAPNAPPCSLDAQCHVTGQVRAVPGRTGHLLASVGLGDLYRTTDAGTSPWEALGAFSEVGGFDFGAPMESGGSPTLFVWGVRQGDGGLALWRSDDDGTTWQFITRYPNDMAAGVTSIAGDPTTPGRVYVGFAGAGAVVGAPAPGR